MATDPKMLELLVCPITGGTLSLNRETQELISFKAKLAYPIRDGVPIMLASEARSLPNNEKIIYKK
ncbi:Trm112 family protein [Bartonella phoceensis]|uniref:Trm112 family protein n=1 Tax=Bartonella phoceensis TaxID=270249 RepID=UPI001ABA7537|nr:Trm112 family protein [Bartonella phoceensis]